MPDILGLAILLALGFVIFVASMIAYTAWALTHPPRRTYAEALAKNIPGDPGELEQPRAFRAWTLAFRGTELPVWTVEGGDPAGPVVVLTHGWGDARLGALARTDPVAAVASEVVLWDLPGHGDAPGISRLGAVEVDALVQLVLALPELERPVVLFGCSMGAGLSMAAAIDPRLEGRVGAVIAEAPYRLPDTPARNVLRWSGMPHRLNLRPALWLLGTLFGQGPGWHEFDRVGLAARLRVPLLVLHGSVDAICPIEDGAAIAQATPHGTLAGIPDGGHNNLWTDPPLRAACTEAVQRFVRELDRPRPHPVESHNQEPTTT